MALEEFGGLSAPAVGVPSIDVTLVVAVVVTLIVVAMIVFVTYLAFGPNVSSQFGDPSDHAIGSGVERPGETGRDAVDRELAGTPDRDDDATDRDATETSDRE